MNTLKMTLASMLPLLSAASVAQQAEPAGASAAPAVAQPSDAQNFPCQQQERFRAFDF